MKKSFIAICCSLLITSSLFSGCSLIPSSKQQTTKQTNPSTDSNTSSSSSGSSSSSSVTSPSNTTNSNSITLSGQNAVSCVYDNTPVIVKDTMYAINHPDNKKLYSFPTPTSVGSKPAFDKIIKVSDDSTFSITTDNSYIYYATNSGLCKTTLDGKEKSTFSTDLGSNIYLSGDSLFYINKSDKNTLYKYSITENKSHRITEDGVLYYAISGDSIIYINKDDNCRIYAISPNGDNNTKISDYSATSFAIGNNKIYYCNPAYDNCIFASNLDGTQSLPLELSPQAEALSCDKDGIYFINHRDFNLLYKISFDGKKVTKVSDVMINSYSLFDKFIITIEKPNNSIKPIMK